MAINTDTGAFLLKGGDIRCEFDQLTGQPAFIGNSKMSISGSELFINVGCDGETKPGFLEFYSLDNLKTWELPRILPNKRPLNSWKFEDCKKRSDSLQMIYTIEHLKITLTYSIIHNNISISADITNQGQKTNIINTVSFIFRNKQVSRDTVFDFPCNVPSGEFKLSELEEYKAVESGLVNSVTHTCTGEEHLNILFVDREEKWGNGVYKDSDNALNCVYSAGVECYLNPGQTINCGELIIQLVGRDNPYLAVRELYKKYGWIPPKDGITDGVLYSCHPNGTMDKGFPYRRTMTEYASELDSIKELGIDHIWVLPIFRDFGRGVYHPDDQAIIDEKYGGDEAVKYFCQRAHELGMTVLFDYVPHGPAPEDELAKRHRDWCSYRRDGNIAIEWDCVSFDMTNPEYIKYTKELVKDHVKRFDIDGARIDCAMGGLPNWKPCEGNRPSSSSVKGGVSISRAIRQGFIESGKTPLVTPENFNPLPLYYEYTDAFYDMPLYRVLYELDEARLEPKEFVRRLTRWLNAELLSTPEGYVKLRFLGNHDTVSWVWQCARATKVYGEEKAKALWVLISTIDGIPMLYQGDEDPAIYMGEGPNLREFFKGLFGARKKYLGNKYDINYEFTGTSIFAFTRRLGDLSRKILINFSPEKETYDLDFKIKNVLYGQCATDAGKLTLEGYGYVILDIQDKGL